MHRGAIVFPRRLERIYPSAGIYNDGCLKASPEVGVTMLKNAGDGAAAWNIMFAGATIAIVPILVIYIFASKYFINGMTAGAVKG
mgnify:CR=1 FL=1